MSNELVMTNELVMSNEPANLI